MLHDRISFYEQLTEQKRKGSVWASAVYFTISYFSGVTACFLRFGFGRWYLRVGTIWLGTAIFASMLLIADWIIFRFLTARGAEIEAFSTLSPAYYLFTLLLVIVPLTQRFLFSGAFKDRELLYSGLPILWPLLRVFTAEKARTRQEEEYFKRTIDPATALLIALLVSADSLWYIRYFFLIGGICLYARESMIRSFYETNKINVEDAMIRTHETAQAAGMRIASHRPTVGVVGQINPALMNGNGTATTPTQENDQPQPDEPAPPRDTLYRERYR